MKLFNTLSGKIEEFKPMEDGKINMYVCGPTVYSYAHVGNMCPVIIFDMVYRYFKYAGYDVKYASNFTDVDDKIIKASIEQGISEKELTDKYIKIYLEDVKALNCLDIDYRPKLLSFMKSIFGERNNYPLFKYLYLIPSRSLLYKNLYSEIEKFLEFWDNPQSSLPLDKMKKKEKEYKEFVNEEVQAILKSTLNENEEQKRYGSYEGDFDEFEYEDLYKDKFFKCKDKRMKNFTGFIGEIIPGKVIREEIFGIAKNSGLAMYRIQYFTKYYQLDELRDRLLNPEKYPKEGDDEEEEEEKKSVKSKESKSSSKSKSSSNSRKSSSSSSGWKKSKSSLSNESKKSEEEKNQEEDKEEQMDKGNEEEKKEEENNEEKEKKENEENKEDDTPKEESNKAVNNSHDNDNESKEEEKAKDEENNKDKPKEEENDVKKKIQEENKENEKHKGEEQIKDEENKENEPPKEEKDEEESKEEERTKQEEPKKEGEEEKNEEKHNENNEDKEPEIEKKEQSEEKENKEEKKDEENKEQEEKENKEEENKEKEDKEEDKENKEQEEKENKEQEEKENKEEENKEQEDKEEDKEDENKEEEEKKTEKSEEEITEEDIKDKERDSKSKDKSNDDEEKNQDDEEDNEKEKEKSDDEEAKKDSKSNSAKSEDKEKEEEEEKENIITEINPDLEERSNAVKYDVSYKNENSFIFKIYREEKDIFILEDPSIKDKNNVRNLVCRYVFANNEPRKKIFHALIKKQIQLKNQVKKNCFILDQIKDNVLPNQNTSFWIVQRFRDNMDFIKKEDIVITIGFDQS